MIAYRGKYEADPARSTLANFNGVELSTRTMPAEGASQGGDWCEAFALSRETIALSIGDVCGHGRECFETMAALRKAVREGARSGLDTSRVLGAASSMLRSTEPRVTATSIFAILNTRFGTMTFANAGHPPPIIGGANGVNVLEFPRKDPPLGVSQALPAEHIVELPADALLVLYTDGVTERERDVVKGEKQLREAAMFAHRVRGMPGAPVIERQMFLQGLNRDDVAILTARTPLLALAIRSSLRLGRPAYQT